MALQEVDDRRCAPAGQHRQDRRRRVGRFRDEGPDADRRRHRGFDNGYATCQNEYVAADMQSLICRRDADRRRHCGFNNGHAIFYGEQAISDME